MESILTAELCSHQTDGRVRIVSSGEHSHPLVAMRRLCRCKHWELDSSTSLLLQELGGTAMAKVSLSNEFNSVVCSVCFGCKGAAKVDYCTSIRANSGPVGDVESQSRRILLI